MTERRIQRAGVDAYPSPAQATVGPMHPVERVLRDRQPAELQVSSDGRHYLLRVLPRIVYARESVGAIVTLSEESELIEVQRRLRESQQRLLAIMEHSATAVAVKDLSGRYEYVNPKFCQLFSMDAEQVIGKTDKQLFPEKLAGHLRERDLDTLRADQPVDGHECLELGDQERCFFAIRFPLRGMDGVAYAICVKLIDPERMGEED